MRALGQLVNQLGHIGGLTIGVHQRGLRHKAIGPLRGGQRLHTAKHTVVFGRHVAQQNSQGGLIKILHTIGANANAYSAHPIVHTWQLVGQKVEHVLRMRRQMVGQIQNPQAGVTGVGGLRHLRLELRQRQSGCHVPLWVRGMRVGE